MLDRIVEFFKGQRAKQKVVETMLKFGIRVDSAGKLYVADIELAPAKVGRGLGIDRRVVIDTAKEIARHPELFRIFSVLEPRSHMAGVAKVLRNTVIVIRADPRQYGIVSKVTAVLAENKVPIRQIIADDPDLFPDPVLTVIVDGRMPTKVIDVLRKLEVANSISIY